MTPDEVKSRKTVSRAFLLAERHGEKVKRFL